MITANLAGSSLQPSYLRGEREKMKSHSRLNLNEDNSDSASNKQNPEDWNPNDTNSDHGQIISEHFNNYNTNATFYRDCSFLIMKFAFCTMLHRVYFKLMSVLPLAAWTIEITVDWISWL